MTIFSPQRNLPLGLGLGVFFSLAVGLYFLWGQYRGQIAKNEKLSTQVATLEAEKDQIFAFYSTLRQKEKEAYEKHTEALLVSLGSSTEDPLPPGTTFYLNRLCELSPDRCLEASGP